MATVLILHLMSPIMARTGLVHTSVVPTLLSASSRNQLTVELLPSHLMNWGFHVSGASLLKIAWNSPRESFLEVQLISFTNRNMAMVGSIPYAQQSTSSWNVRGAWDIIDIITPRAEPCKETKAKGKNKTNKKTFFPLIPGYLEKSLM